MGSGYNIPPATGTSSAAGTFTIWWTLDVAGKRCGTITATATGAQASVSFWIAAASDPQSGATCVDPTAHQSGAPAATTTSVSTPVTRTTPAPAAAASQPAAPLPTSTPTPAPAANSSLTGQLRATLVQLPWKWVAIGGVALLVVLLLGLASAGARKTGARGRQSAARGQALPGYGHRVGLQAGGMRYGAAAQWVAPETRQAPEYAPHREPDVRYRQQVPQPQPQVAPGTPQRLGQAAGAMFGHTSTDARRLDQRGPAQRAWRTADHDPPQHRAPVPDVRWSRSHPGARGSRGAAAPREPARRSIWMR
jgi:hypothetical protein